MPAMPVAPPCASMARYSCARSSPDQKRPSKRSASRRARLMMRRLRKMIAHEVSEASSRMAITICTGTLACAISLTIDSGPPMRRLLRRQHREQELRQPARLEAAGVDARDAQLRLQQQPGRRRAIACLAVDALHEVQRGRALRA